MAAETGEDGSPSGTSAQPAGSQSAAQIMRAGREAAGMSLADVAQVTRVPQRHLEALERGEYSALPSITYCTGFARAYARAVKIDAIALVARVREEVNSAGDEPGARHSFAESADPARVPPRALALGALALAVLLLGAYALWRMQSNALPAEIAVAPPPAAPSPSVRPVAPAPTGPVVLTAIDDVWMRIYEKDGRRYFDQILAKGSSFTVPADAANPLILTGRPDALAVAVGGRLVPPLGVAERTIADVPINAAALLARRAGDAAAAQTASPLPSSSSRPRPRPRDQGTAQSQTAPVPAVPAASEPVAVASPDNASAN